MDCWMTIKQGWLFCVGFSLSTEDQCHHLSPTTSTTCIIYISILHIKHKEYNLFPFGFGCVLLIESLGAHVYKSLLESLGAGNLTIVFLVASKCYCCMKNKNPFNFWTCFICLKKLLTKHTVLCIIKLLVYNKVEGYTTKGRLVQTLTDWYT